MLYTDFEVGNETYKLRLNTRSIVTLENKIGKSACAIFGNGDTLPSIFELVMVLHAGLQAYNHGISVDDAYTILDKWLEEGHSIEEFYPIVVELYQVSGLFKKTEKN